MVYVDLNPIRAGIAETQETSDFTSVQDRLADLKSAQEVSRADALDVRIEHSEQAGWLASVGSFGKRRAANSGTPAIRHNAHADPGKSSAAKPTRRM